MDREMPNYKMFENLPEQTLRCVFEGLIVLGTAGQAYQEYQQAQAVHQQQNEELRDIRETLAKLQTEQERQTASIQKERARWEERQASYQEELKTLDRALAEKTQALAAMRQSLEKKDQEITQAQERLGRLEASYKADQQKLEAQHQTELDHLKQQHHTELSNLETARRTEEDRIRQEDQAALEKAVEEYQEIHEDWELYHTYKNWIAKNQSKINLNGLKCDRFSSFIACCGQRWVLTYIFQELVTLNLWAWAPEDVKVLDRVIDCCCKLQGLRRLKSNGTYDYDFHYKREDGPENGYIHHALLEGVEENGEALGECKSFVELALD